MTFLNLFITFNMNKLQIETDPKNTFSNSSMWFPCIIYIFFYYYLRLENTPTHTVVQAKLLIKNNKKWWPQFPFFSK